MSRSKFWNRAEFFTLAAIWLVALLSWLPLFLVTAPFVLATRAAKLLADITSKRMERLEATYYIILVRNLAERGK